MHRTFYKFFQYFLLSTLIFFSVASMMAQSATSYEEAITKGNTEMAKKKFIDAKAYFLLALQMEPGDSLANAKIKTIIDELKKEGAKKEVYYQWIDQGDSYLNNNALDAAQQAYDKALKIIPGDQYAVNQIKEITNLREAQKNKLQAYNNFMLKGDQLLKRKQFNPALFAFKKADSLFPKSNLPKTKIQLTLKLQKEYEKKTKIAESYIEKAKQYLLINDYISALKNLYSADSLIPDNEALQYRITQIAPLARKQQNYNQWIQQGDKLYLTKNFMAARMKYQQAKRVWPEQSYPEEMIGRIDNRIQDQRAHLVANYNKAIHQADSLFHVSDWENSRAEYNLALNLKPDETYPKEQIKAIDKALLAQREQNKAIYAGIIKSADSLFNLKQFKGSQKLYLMAIKLHPEDPYPAQRINEIDAKLARLMAAKKLEQQYSLAIEKADSLYQEKEWNSALIQYSNASNLKPEESYPKDQIKLINEKLLSLKQQKANDEKYSLQMEKGKGFYNNSEWNNAVSTFKIALSFKPSEEEPALYIKRIDSILQQIASQHKLDSTYQVLFANGMQQMNSKKYELALKSFEDAQNIKPTEPAPGQKINVIKNILDELAKTASINKKYQDIIASADSLYKQTHYEQAIQQYKTALNVKSDELYPKNRIVLINDLLAKLEKEKTQRFNSAVAEGDRYFNIQNYQKALTAYQLAQSIKPDASYPVRQINQCEIKLKSIAEQVMKQYRQVMSEANQYYNGKIFDQAIASYKKAHEIKPDETLPEEMIKKITKYIEEHAVEDILNNDITINANQKRTFKFKPVNVTVRNNNYVLIKANNISGNAFNILVTYGKDGERNGGFVIQVPKGKAEHDFIIRVGTQYKWFSEDNNWLSVYPENNALEISLIRISKTD
ncbi:MAG: hypothetical protein JXR65_08995 [Bacteroidales bacterium]|nr:hypothetical protein [Bacteroidales bacterium]